MPEVTFDSAAAFDVAAIAHLARKTLCPGQPARVGAVFDNTFYIETPTLWVCVAGPSCPMGPLTLRCGAPARTHWRQSGVRIGMRVHVGRGALHLPPLFVLRFADASTWVPPAPSPWTARSLRRGLSSLARCMRDLPPTPDGLGRVLRPGSGTGPSAVVHARPPVARLHRWLDAAMAAGSAALPVDSVAALAGLGPGLTPSGDDFLGGMIVGLRALGHGQAAEDLYRTITALPGFGDNAISAAHLSAAAQGACSAPLHAALNAVLTGDATALPTALVQTARIGHTSGWDGLAGIATALAAWSANAPGGRRMTSTARAPDEPQGGPVGGERHSAGRRSRQPGGQEPPQVAEDGAITVRQSSLRRHLDASDHPLF